MFSLTTPRQAAAASSNPAAASRLKRRDGGAVRTTFAAVAVKLHSRSAPLAIDASQQRVMVDVGQIGRWIDQY
jgi:hypothetical protein